MSFKPERHLLGVMVMLLLVGSITVSGVGRTPSTEIEIDGAFEETWAEAIEFPLMFEFEGGAPVHVEIRFFEVEGGLLLCAGRYFTAGPSLLEIPDLQVHVIADAGDGIPRTTGDLLVTIPLGDSDPEETTYVYEAPRMAASIEGLVGRGVGQWGLCGQMVEFETVFELPEWIQPEEADGLQVFFGMGVAGAQPVGGVAGPVVLSSVVVWSPDRKLKWSDFQGDPPEDPQTESAEVWTGLKYGCTTAIPVQSGPKKWRTKVQTTSVQSEMTQTKSWVVPKDKSDDLLNHEQRHFDLTEVYRRKFEAALKELVGVGDTSKGATEDLYRKIDELYEEIEQERQRQQKRYDDETKHGTDDAKQKEWNDRIDRWLADPGSAPGPGG